MHLLVLNMFNLNPCKISIYTGLFINNLTISTFYCKKTDDAIGTCIIGTSHLYPEVRERITNAVALISMDDLVTVCDELKYRIDVCRVTHGAHIENLYG
jgi:hypothetical protein